MSAPAKFMFDIDFGAPKPANTVALGEHIVTDGVWEVSATTASGEPLSIGVTRAGKLIVGTFTGDLRCPCIGD